MPSSSTRMSLLGGGPMRKAIRPSGGGAMDRNEYQDHGSVLGDATSYYQGKNYIDTSTNMNRNNNRNTFFDRLHKGNSYREEREKDSTISRRHLHSSAGNENSSYGMNTLSHSKFSTEEIRGNGKSIMKKNSRLKAQSKQFNYDSNPNSHEDNLSSKPRSISLVSRKGGSSNALNSGTREKKSLMNSTREKKNSGQNLSSSPVSTRRTIKGGKNKIDARYTKVGENMAQQNVNQDKGNENMNTTQTSIQSLEEFGDELNGMKEELEGQVDKVRAINVSVGLSAVENSALCDPKSLDVFSKILDMNEEILELINEYQIILQEKIQASEKEKEKAEKAWENERKKKAIRDKDYNQNMAETVQSQKNQQEMVDVPFQGVSNKNNYGQGKTRLSFNGDEEINSSEASIPVGENHEEKEEVVHSAKENDETDENCNLKLHQVDNDLISNDIANSANTLTPKRKPPVCPSLILKPAEDAFNEISNDHDLLSPPPIANLKFSAATTKVLVACNSPLVMKPKKKRTLETTGTSSLTSPGTFLGSQPLSEVSIAEKDTDQTGLSLKVDTNEKQGQDQEKEIRENQVRDNLEEEDDDEDKNTISSPVFRTGIKLIRPLTAKLDRIKERRNRDNRLSLDSSALRNLSTNLDFGDNRRGSFSANKADSISNRRDSISSYNQGINLNTSRRSSSGSDRGGILNASTMSIYSQYSGFSSDSGAHCPTPPNFIPPSISHDATGKKLLRTDAEGRTSYGYWWDQNFDGNDDNQMNTNVASTDTPGMTKEIHSQREEINSAKDYHQELNIQQETPTSNGRHSANDSPSNSSDSSDISAIIPTPFKVGKEDRRGSASRVRTPLATEGEFNLEREREKFRSAVREDTHRKQLQLLEKETAAEEEEERRGRILYPRSEQKKSLSERADETNFDRNDHNRNAEENRPQSRQSDQGRSTPQLRRILSYNNDGEIRSTSGDLNTGSVMNETIDDFASTSLSSEIELNHIPFQHSPQPREMEITESTENSQPTTAIPSSGEEENLVGQLSTAFETSLSVSRPLPSTATPIRITRTSLCGLQDQITPPTREEDPLALPDHDYYLRSVEKKRKEIAILEAQQAKLQAELTPESRLKYSLRSTEKKKRERAEKEVLKGTIESESSKKNFLGFSRSPFVQKEQRQTDIMTDSSNYRTARVLDLDDPDQRNHTGSVNENNAEPLDTESNDMNASIVNVEKKPMLSVSEHEYNTFLDSVSSDANNPNPTFKQINDLIHHINGLIASKFSNAPSLSQREIMELIGVGKKSKAALIALIGMGRIEMYIDDNTQERRFMAWRED